MNERREPAHEVGSVNVQASLAVVVVALLGLQGPACAWACSSQAAELSSEATPGPSCHESAPASAEAPTPEGSPAGQMACGCETASPPLRSAPQAPAPGVALSLAAVPAPFQAIPVRTTPHWPSWHQKSLPPPDILLRKASLLL